MSSIFQAYYVDKIHAIVQSECTNKTNLIFVILGQTSLWKDLFPSDVLVDPTSIHQEHKHHYYDEKWYNTTKKVLNQTKDFHILSYAQFSYMLQRMETLHPAFLDRAIIIEDNLRQLFPLDKADYFDVMADENIQLRHPDLPLHQIEQVQVHDYYYYSINRLETTIRTIPLFEEEAELTSSTEKNSNNINLTSELFALDLLINRTIQSLDFNKKTDITYYSKQPHDGRLLSNLRKWNAVVKHFGGELLYDSVHDLNKDSLIKPETYVLLTKHWGEGTAFRHLSVYKNPDIDNETLTISQGAVVQAIISSYENTKQHKKARDIFLTAPTGAGKSLIFQLPAFYISTRGDMTIVISPLIALMKDQVEALITERNFEKVAYINGELSLLERENVIKECQAGNIDILYMSPELFLAYDISYFTAHRNIGLLVIDEAHLITTWGRDFRVDYWFLGDYVQKLRNIQNLNFTMIAVTATAIYGGTNDMVFDSISSLHMRNPHLFIGQVKRDDITFVLQNYDQFEKKHEDLKLQQSISFIKEIHELNLKTLVYTPYTKQIGAIMEQLNGEKKDIVTGYHGGMTSESKEFAFRQFKSNKKNIMLCTKAFGMGIDIADIELVYHHAPSGLLPDYIQEIGRAARKPDIQGVAAINYHPNDLLFAKTLHNMSTIKPHQLLQVLRKLIFNYYSNYKQQNLILAADDFEYIFDKGQDVQQKTLTALMLIEKDYILKNGFPILTARPKKLSVSGYASISDEDLCSLAIHYPNTYEVISTRKNGKHIIELNIDKIWKEHTQEQSFAVLKSNFYKGNLFKDLGIKIEPQLKIIFERLDDSTNIATKLSRILNAIQQSLTLLPGFFTADQFEHKLNENIQNKAIVGKISTLLFSVFIGSSYSVRHRQPNTFLQRRTIGDEIKYLAQMDLFNSTCSQLESLVKGLFANSDNRRISRFLTKKNINSDSYIKLGNLLETLGLVTFKIRGGEKTMIHIRINVPSRLEKDSENLNYNNILLAQTIERHEVSNLLFNHFFMNQYDNNSRWTFIEDYFLGMPTDDLLEKYPPTIKNSTDLKETIQDLIIRKPKTAPQTTSPPLPLEETVSETSLHIFPATSEDILSQNKLLTIRNDDTIRTMRVSEWLIVDPVALDKERCKVNCKLESQTLQILISKLKANHFEYYRDQRRLQLVIHFNKYDSPVKAILPYTDKPIEFYKWWSENPNKITMSFKEKLILFDKVYLKNAKALKAEHKKLLARK